MYIVLRVTSHVRKYPKQNSVQFTFICIVLSTIHIISKSTLYFRVIFYKRQLSISEKYMYKTTVSEKGIHLINLII